MVEGVWDLNGTDETDGTDGSMRRNRGSIRPIYPSVSSVLSVPFKLPYEHPETIASDRPRYTTLGDLFNGVVAENLFDVVNENLLSACRIGLLAQESLGRARHTFGHRGETLSTV